MSDITYMSPHGELPGYLAVPSGPGGPSPAVVLIHDIFGMSANLRAHADRFANHGYIALAPDLFAWGGKIRCLRAIFAALRDRTGRPFDYIDAARQWVAKRNDCTGRVGVIGYCMGGGFALLAASPEHEFAASSVNYGTVPDDAESVLAGACPIVGSFGGRDHHPPSGTANRLANTLESLGIDHDVKEYSGVGHGFMNDHRGPVTVIAKVMGAGYNAEASEDAWGRILDFFGQHLRLP
ncbi:MAG: dienelactone hydrolase family protein [Candidatus Dormibacteraceae bacterium]